MSVKINSVISDMFYIQRFTNIIFCFKNFYDGTVELFDIVCNILEVLLFVPVQFDLKNITYLYSHNLDASYGGKATVLASKHESIHIWRFLLLVFRFRYNS